MTERWKFRGMLLLCVPAFLIGMLASPEVTTRPVTHQVADNSAEPAPPDGQTYIGTKKCSSCHFEQYGIWIKDKHAKAFDILPEKYRTDDSCLKCHTTGYGEETGFKTVADTHLAGTSCEACHGPGSKHEEICQEFTTVNKLTAEQEKMARDSIYLMQPKNVCMDCHATKGHKTHPEFDR